MQEVVITPQPFIFLLGPGGPFTASSSGGGGGLEGTGSPEGVITADEGTTYYDSASGAFYVKGSGSGNTGWVALIV